MHACDSHLAMPPARLQGLGDSYRVAAPRPERADPQRRACRFNQHGGDPTVVSYVATSPATALSNPVGNVYMRAAGTDSLLQTDDGTTSFFQPARGAPDRAPLHAPVCTHCLPGCLAQSGTAVCAEL